MHAHALHRRYGHADRPLHDRPLAASGLKSYRYLGDYGWIMIGARDDADALREAKRSMGKGSKATRDKLQAWDRLADRYVPVTG
jgi:hypothetical protein